MGDGTKENPYTREDVLEAIKKNGGDAQGLSFSGKRFVEGIDLRSLDLKCVDFCKAIFSLNKEHPPVSVYFNGSNLTSAKFREMNLEYAQFGMLNDTLTCLTDSDFRNTQLLNASFQGADLSLAVFGRTDDMNFGAASLDNTDFRYSTLFRTNFKDCFFMVPNLKEF